MWRSFLLVGSGAAFAWVGVDLLYNFLRLSDSYGRMFLF
jgi:hypothetical protein